jgi:hypothetical protein
LTYYLVKTAKEDDRPTEVAEYLAHHMAVIFHAEVWAKPWYPGQWEGTSQRPGDEEPDQGWQKYNTRGKIEPPKEEEEADG